MFRLAMLDDPAAVDEDHMIADTPLQTAALVVGVVFLLVGIAGFVPGVTTNYDMMTFAGHHSQAQLLIRRDPVARAP